MRLPEPVRIGWKSVAANALPMAVLWLLAVAMVWAYYHFPCAAAAVDPLAKWQTECGWLASFFNRLFFAGVVPGVFLVTVKALRVRRPVWVALTQGVWCGVWGIVCGWFYELQAFAFGNDSSVATLALKTVVDQFVWTVLVVAPANGVFFLWVGQDFSVARTRRAWPRRFYSELVLPLLLPNWCLWIPVVAIVYAFPLPLQVQVSGLALAASMLLSLFIGRQVGKEQSA